MKKIIAIIFFIASLPLLGMAIERHLATQHSQESIDRFLNQRIDYANNVMTEQEANDRAHRMNRQMMRQTSERNMWGAFGIIALSGGIILLFMTKKKS